MAQRFVEGLNNHERLSKYSYRKYEMRSPLGQLQSMYNVQPTGQYLSVLLPTKHDPLKRNSFAAGKTIRRLETSGQISPTHRNKSAPIWVKVPNHVEMWESCAFDETPRARRVVFSPSRPQTVDGVGGRSTPNIVAFKQKPGEARGRPHTNSTLYRFKPIDLRASYSKENIQLCTALIKEQWDSKERQYLNTGIYARGRPKNKEQELLQWFTFEGDSPGALSAFTKDQTGEEAEKEEPKFSIEANVGKEVAAKLVLGGHVRIGHNGTLLLEQEVDEADENALFRGRCDSALRMTRSAANKHEPLYPPLCWYDVEKEARIILAKRQNENQDKNSQSSKTMPVVYNANPSIKPYVPPGFHSDENKLSRLLSHKSTPKPPQEESSLTYEEVLESRTLHSRQEKSDMIAAPSREYTTPDPTKFNRAYKPPKQLSAKPPVPVRAKTPSIPEEVKSGIQRQVTMPCYNVLPTKPANKVTGRPKTGNEVLERTVTPTRPPRYTPTYSAGGGTTPTISNHGVEGDKSYMQIATPLNSTFKQEAHDVGMKISKSVDSKTARTAPIYKEHKTRLNNTPADISSVTLVGKAPPLDRGTKSSHKQLSNTEESSQPSQSQVFTTTDDSAITPLVEESKPPGKLNINIPAVDMISASSAAVNSIADFLEFDNSSVRANKQTNEVVADMNNNQSSESQAELLNSDRAGSDKPPSIGSFDEQVENFSISVEVSELTNKNS